MIHLDTNALSTLANNPQLSQDFIGYLDRTDETLLLNHFQLTEMAKSTSHYYVEQRREFIERLPRKRYMMIGIIEVIYQEIASYAQNDRILTPKQFEKHFTVPVEKGEDLKELFDAARRSWDGIKEMARSWGWWYAVRQADLNEEGARRCETKGQRLP